MREWLGYLPHYAAAPLDPDWVGWLGPEMMAARCGLCIAILGAACLARPDPWAIALTTATALGIAVQRRYFSYHPACLGPVLVLCAAPGIRRGFAAGTGSKPASRLRSWGMRAPGARQAILSPVARTSARQSVIRSSTWSRSRPAMSI